MRQNVILIGIIFVLGTALLVGYARTSAHIERLEGEIRAMDTTLKQFAMPMNDLRLDITGIHAELDALRAVPPAVADTRAESGAEISSHGDSAPDSAAERERLMLDASHNAALAYYGNQEAPASQDAYGQKSPTGPRTTFADPVDEED